MDYTILANFSSTLGELRSPKAKSILSRLLNRKSIKVQSTSSDNSVDNDLTPENLQGFLRAENILILDILAFGDPVARWQVAGAP